MMTSRAAAADSMDVYVLILKKIQGGVWSEVGRTALCPTVAWLSQQHGAGQYELRLHQRTRMLCICKADCARVQPSTDGAPPNSTRRLASNGAGPSFTAAGGAAANGTAAHDRAANGTAANGTAAHNRAAQDGAAPEDAALERNGPESDASWLRAGNARGPARTALRGTVLG